MLLLLGAFAAGLAAVAAVGAIDDRELAFSINARVVRWVAVAPPGEEVCQVGLESAAAFDMVEVRLGTGPEPGPAMDAVVRAAGTPTVLARGRLPAGARDNRDVRAELTPQVAEGRDVDVCFRNLGTREIAFYGGPPYESPGGATAAGRPADGDVHILFLRREPETALALVPDMFERAARFRPPGVGAWTFWLLLAGVAVATPAALAGALRAATRGDRDGPDPT
ncbi:MAG TPA: hypothetical protein VF712_04595 [Thermoleophilaceae bacterium]